MARQRAIRWLALAAALISSVLRAAAQTPPPPQPMAPTQLPGQGVQAGQRPPQPPGKIAGKVLRADNGRPLTKATASIQPEGRFSDQQTTRVDTNGAFEFPEVAPGRYRLSVQRNGYVTQTYGQRGGGPGVSIEIQSRQVRDGIEFRLERGGVISGAVVDEDNEPVENVEVRAQRVRFQPGGRQRAVSVKTVRTDDQGNYRLSGLAPGYYYVQSGARAEGFDFGAMSSGFSYAGNYYPGVEAREQAQRVQVTAGGETRRIDFSLRPAKTYTVSGIIVDPQPASGVMYSVGLMRAGGSFFTSAVNDEGKFSIRGVEPGEHTVQVMSFGQNLAQQRGFRSVTVTDADVQVVVELGKAAELGGEVKTLDNTPLPARFFVSLASENESPTGGGALVADGRFSIKGVPEGSFTINANDPAGSMYVKEVRCNGEDYTLRRIQIENEQRITDCVITMAKDMAVLEAVVERDGKPMEGSVVVLLPRNEDHRKNGRYVRVGQSDKDGVARLRGIVPGDYYAFAMPPSDDLIYYDLEFYSRNRDTAISLTAQSTGQHTLTLKVITPK